mgnify:CR=1 FL=1
MTRRDGHKLPLTGPDLVHHSGCPVCGSAAVRPFSRTEHNGTQLTHQLCAACGLLFMDPVPTQDWYDRLYREEFWEVKARTPGEQADAGQRNPAYWWKALGRAEKFADLLSQHAEKGAIQSVLEIGAAYGVIGRYLADQLGVRTYAVEPNETARTFAAGVCGATLVGRSVSDVSQWRPDRPLDLVMFSHVLENIVDQDATMRAVKRVLRPGGYLLIETPNAAEKASMSIYHPYCFTRSSLEHLLGRHGFRVRSAATSGRPASVLSRRYLTVLATNEPPTAAPRREPGMLALRRRAAHALSFAKRGGPIGYVDRLVVRSKYRPSEHSRALMQYLSAQSALRKAG